MNLYHLFSLWDSEIRPVTIECVARMNNEELDWKPPSWHSSSLELINHMCNVEWIWIYRNVLKKEPWESRWNTKSFQSIDHLLSYWEDIHNHSVELLKNTSINDLQNKYDTPYGKSYSLQWIISHVIEHEIHHRGQMMMMMRMMGLEPPKI